MDGERDALVALYRATNGGSWERATRWCTNAPLSEWYGVKVSDGRVVELNLFSNNLRGSIPKELGQLGALTELFLGNNKLEGSIPKEMEQLGALTTLYLGGNKLEGSIPKELGQLGALTELDLSNNKLGGSIPKELGQLGALTGLYLVSNKLEGSIPKELGRLGALTRLSLGGNELEGSIPTELGKLSALRTLYLLNNKLEGSIPTELAQLGALKYFNLSGNKLEVVPHEIAVAFRRIHSDFRNNSWKVPPSDVVGQGLEAVIRYWQDAKHYGRIFSNRLKVVLVGLGSAGKTSLAIRLEGGDGESLPREEERTVGVEIRDLRLKPSPASHPQHSGQDLAVKLWDFAGQRAYYDTHQIFLTKDALYILVVDVSTYRVGHTPAEAMEQWVDIIQSRVPGAVILLVGTHKDALVNTGLCDERMRKLHQDVEDCTSRLRKKVEARRRRALHNRSDHQVVRVVNGHDVSLFDCKTSGEDEINRLRSFIATVAYSSDYSFPSVESQIPTPWVYAFLTLEAIRRGADLRGVSGEMTGVLERLEGGDPKTAKYFVFFNDALLLFKDLWKAMNSETQSGSPALALFKNLIEGIGIKKVRPMQSEEKANEVFFNAVGLNEAQGWILLTNRDGSVDGMHDDMYGDQVNRSQLILHVDPVRFADVVRRIVDIRLVDSASKLKIMEALKDFARITGVRLHELTEQQGRFYIAGEVSKDYLKFLWGHRELDLGKATKEAPPLEMTDEDVDAMVGSLVDLRVMFPVRNGSGHVLRDRYVVGACLPDHVGYEVHPESFLELTIGSAMFRLDLEIDGSRNMPPGLIPRLLAWCGRGEGRIIACWRRGGCFTYKNHLVLIYERRISESRSSIVCCAKGTANTEEAGGVLADVAKEVDCLICDPRLGFPGIELSRGDMIKQNVGQDNDLRALLKKLEENLEDHMNLKIDELERRSERIAYDVNAYLHTELRALRGGIEKKIDFWAALVGECLLVSSKDDCPCPRLVWIEEDKPSSKQRFGPFRRKSWLKKGKTPATRFRVSFLCAHDYSLVACGANENGYVLEQKDWQRWLKKWLPVLQVTLWVLRLGVSFVTRTDLLPMDEALATLKELAGEEVAIKMEELDLKRESDGMGTMPLNLNRQVEMYGSSYKALAEFVQEEEDKLPNTTHGVRSFEKEMVCAYRVDSSTEEVEVAWVRRVNEKAWQAAVGSMVSGPVP